MKKIFFTPGPSQLYPTVPGHIKKALDENILSISHRGDKFHEIYESTIDSLKKLLKIPKSHHIFFLSSATEAMERIIENLVEKRSLHFVNGAFSSLFYETALNLQKETTKVEAKAGEGFNFDKLDISARAEIACFTQNETSTGVSIPLDYIYKFKRSYPNLMVALDIVSSVPYIDVDYERIDCVFFSVQKGFGLPAGLGVLIISSQALEKSQRLAKTSKNGQTYHSFNNLLKYYDKKESPETPNVLAIYLLGKVTDDFREQTINSIRKRTEEKAALLYNFFKDSHKFSIFVKNEDFRSKTVIVAHVAGGSKPLIQILKNKGLVVGSGYRDFAQKQIRIANFPAHTTSDVYSLIKLIK